MRWPCWITFKFEVAHTHSLATFVIIIMTTTTTYSTRLDFFSVYQESMYRSVELSCPGTGIDRFRRKRKR